MKRTIALAATLCAMLFTFALGAPGTAAAALVVTTHDATSLIGTFSLSGAFEQDEVNSGPFVPLFPVTATCTSQVFSGRRNNVNGETLRDLILATNCDGAPDDPDFRNFSAIDGLMTYANVSGSYANNPAGTMVYFRFSDLQDTGGLDTGVFSGAFCFSTQESTCAAATVPEPGTLALLGLGLAGLAATRRRKQ